MNDEYMTAGNADLGRPTLGTQPPAETPNQAAPSQPADPPAETRASWDPAKGDFRARWGWDSIPPAGGFGEYAQADPAAYGDVLTLYSIIKMPEPEADPLGLAAMMLLAQPIGQMVWEHDALCAQIVEALTAYAFQVSPYSLGDPSRIRSFITGIVREYAGSMVEAGSVGTPDEIAQTLPNPLRYGQAAWVNATTFTDRAAGQWRFLSLPFGDHVQIVTARELDPSQPQITNAPPRESGLYVLAHFCQGYYYHLFYIGSPGSSTRFAAQPLDLSPLAPDLNGPQPADPSQGPREYVGRQIDAPLPPETPGGWGMGDNGLIRFPQRPRRSHD
jgi:hypothetical protein